MDRDQWIGWTKQDREKRLNLVTNNKRFLILPWVKVPNLASHVLLLALRQLREDWYQAHAYRPVRVETFVDDSRYNGSKLNLPRELLEAGYKKPQQNRYYPQGLLSYCYQLKSKIPYDFDLVSHGNERICADQLS